MLLIALYLVALNIIAIAIRFVALRLYTRSIFALNTLQERHTWWKQLGDSRSVSRPTSGSYAHCPKRVGQQ